MLLKKLPPKEDASSSATHSLFYFTFLFYVFIWLRGKVLGMFFCFIVFCIFAL